MTYVNLDDPMVCANHREAVIAFLREHGVDVVMEPVVYMPAGHTRERYAFHGSGSPAIPRERLTLQEALERVRGRLKRGENADRRWQARVLRERADNIENKEVSPCA